jgi:hypothetical protein
MRCGSCSFRRISRRCSSLSFSSLTLTL